MRLPWLPLLAALLPACAGSEKVPPVTGTEYRIALASRAEVDRAHAIAAEVAARFDMWPSRSGADLGGLQYRAVTGPPYVPVALGIEADALRLLVVTAIPTPTEEALGRLRDLDAAVREALEGAFPGRVTIERVPGVDGPGGTAESLEPL